jgi:hypothetical protein
MSDTLAYYNACRTLVTTLREISEAWIRSSYAPAALAPFQQQIGNLGIDTLTLNVLGEPLYAVISVPPVRNRYNPAYIAGLNTYLNSVNSQANYLSTQLTSYAALAASNDDLAHAAMVNVMELEIGTNTFRDPFNMSYPPFPTMVATEADPTGFVAAT